MTFAEAKEICKNLTCHGIRARMERSGSYARISVWKFGLDKDLEFTRNPEATGFSLYDDVMFPLSGLKAMDGNTLIETVRDAMFKIWTHEFHEYFKYKEKTVQSPHISLFSKESK